MKLAIATTALLSLALMGCQGSDSKGSGGAPPEVVRETADFKPEAGPTLTENEKSDFRQLFKNSEVNSVDTDILVGEDDTQEKAARRADRLNQASPFTRQLIDRTKNNCKIVQPKKSASGDIKFPGSTQVNTETASIDGDGGCPVSFSSLHTTKLLNKNAVRNQNDQVNGRITFQGESNYFYKILSPADAANAGFQETSLNSRLHGAMDIVNNAQHIDIQGDGTGHMTLSNGEQIPARIHIDILNNSEKNTAEGVSHMVLTYQGKEYHLSIHRVKVAGNIKVKEAFLNKEKIPAEGFENLFANLD